MLNGAGRWQEIDWSTGNQQLQTVQLVSLLSYTSSKDSTRRHFVFLLISWDSRWTAGYVIHYAPANGTEIGKQETSSFKREIYSLYNVLRSMIILYFFCCVKGIVALYHHHMALLCIIEEFLIYLFYRDLNRPKGATATLLKTYGERAIVHVNTTQESFGIHHENMESHGREWTTTVTAAKSWFHVVDITLPLGVTQWWTITV